MEGQGARRGQTSLLLLSWPGQLGTLCLWHLVVGPPTGGHREVVRRGHSRGEGGEVVRRGHGGEREGGEVVRRGHSRGEGGREW